MQRQGRDALRLFKPLKALISTPLCRRAILVMAFLLVSSGVLFSAFNAPQRAEAALAGTSKALNFQARLLTNTGSLVPDGLYNIRFKIYDVSSAGTALWTDARYDTNGVTAGNDFRLNVVNGYFSVNLGDTDPAVGGTAFSGIDWSQQLWLTMDIGGTTQTATPTYDGEMTPRIALTAVPLAFTANNVNSGNTSVASTNSANTLLQSGNATGATSNTGMVTLQSGNATGTSGNVLLDVGTGATAGSLLLGTANPTTAITVGATTGTSTITLGQSVSGQPINIGNAVNTTAQTIQIANGASAANSTVSILSGAGTAGAGTLSLANNVRVTTINLGNSANVANRTTTINGGATPTTISDTVNIATGNTVGSGSKVVHIADGTPAGTNIVTIGSIASTANVTTIQGGNGAGAISLQAAASGTILIGTTNNNAITTGTGLTTLGGNLTVQGGTTTLGTSSSVAGSLVIYDANGQKATITLSDIAADRAISIPAATATDIFCLQTLANCGGVAAINNNTTLQTTANFNIQSTAVGSVTAALRQLGSQTADILQVRDSGNTTNLSGIDASGNFYLGATSSLKVTGGATGSRPASPTEGQVWFDTTLKQLLVYSNAKWQADRSNSTYIVAASNAVQKDKADYVATGTADQTPINSAITAANTAGGGVVYLTEGTFTINATVIMKSNVRLIGSGKGTIITIANGFNTAIDLITSSGSNTNYEIRDLTVNANYTNNTTGSPDIKAINLGSGSSTGATSVRGTLVDNVYILDPRTYGIYLSGNHNIVSNSFFDCNRTTGFAAAITGSYSQLSGNRITDCGDLYIGGSSNIVSNNVLTNSGNTGAIYISGGSNTTVTGNNISASTAPGIYLVSTTNTLISNNTISSSGGIAGMVLSNLTGGVVNSNSISSSTGDGIYISTGSNFKVNDNTITSSTGNGIFASGGSGVDISSNYINSSGSDGIEMVIFSSSVIASNQIRSSTANGIYLYLGVSGTTISDNNIYDSGASGSSSGINIDSAGGASNNNKVIANTIYDTAGTGYAITIAASNLNTYLSGNTYSGTGASSINNLGSGTIFSNQQDSSGNIITRGQAGIGLNVTAPVYSLQAAGSFVNGALATPAVPTVTTVGTAGSTSYTYAVTAYDGLGETLASTGTVIATGNATLNGSNYNRIVPARVSGAISYKIYRTASSGTPSSTGLIGTLAGGAATFQFDDTGIAGGAAVPTANATGQGQFAGLVTAQNGLGVTGTATINQSAAANGLNITSTNASQISSSALSVIQSGTTTGFTGNFVDIIGSSTTGTGSILSVTSVNTTSGNALNVTANALTTGKGLNVNSTSVITTTGSLAVFTANNATTSNGVVAINATGLTSGAALQVTAAGSAIAINTTGRLIVSATPSTGDNVLKVDGTITSTTNNQQALRVSTTIAPGSAVAASTQYVGVNSVLVSNSANLALGNLVGINGGGYVYGTTNLNAIAGLQTYIENASSGTLSYAYGAFITNPYNTGGGTITNNYGIYIDYQTAGVNNAALFAGGDIVVGKKTDSGGTTSDWAKVTGTAGTICDSGATNVGEVYYATATYNGSLYMGTTNSTSGAELCRYNGGTSWTRINSAAGTFGSDTAIDEIRSMVVYNGYLYFGVLESAKAAVYRYDGTNITRLNTTQGTLNSTASINGVISMAVHGGVLYVGTDEPAKAEVYSYDGGTGATVFTLVTNATAGTITASGTAAIDYANTLISYNGNLYLSTGKSATAEVYRYEGAQVWTKVAAAADIGSSLLATNMAVYAGSLYVTINTAAGANVYRYNSTQGGSTNSWTSVVNAAGQIISGGTSGIDAIYSIALHNGKLYIGTLDSPGNAEVYRYEGEGKSWTKVSQATAGTIKSGGTTGIYGVIMLASHNGLLYAGTINGGAAEIYAFSETEGLSYALKFRARSDGNAAVGVDASGTEQSSYPNEASILFAAEVQGLGASGSSTGSFLFSHGILSTTGAYDLAEDYATRDDSLAAGDLITIDPYETGFVRKSTGLGDKAIVGIYSTNPALRLSQKDSTINGGRAVPVALAGRVPVKVSTENGVIASGDPLTSSSIPGVAMKATSNSRIVGMAMENYTSSDPTAIGKVVVFVNPNWYSGITQGGTADLNTLNATDLTVTGTAIINTLNVTGAATIETLTVTGNASLSELTVTGVTTLKDLVVTGAASLKIVTVERIITSGEAPTVVPLAHAGLNSTATVEGNDTAGTIMLTTGDGAQVSSGEVVELTFTSPLERTPRVNLSPLNGATAGMQWYIERTMTSVKIYFTGTPTAATEYKFDYQILE